jgi:hypothetical protein
MTVYLVDPTPHGAKYLKEFVLSPRPWTGWISKERIGEGNIAFLKSVPNFSFDVTAQSYGKPVLDGEFRKNFEDAQFLMQMMMRVKMRWVPT